MGMEGVDSRMLERFFQNIKSIAESLDRIAMVLEADACSHIAMEESHERDKRAREELNERIDACDTGDAP